MALVQHAPPGCKHGLCERRACGCEQRYALWLLPLVRVSVQARRLGAGCHASAAIGERGTLDLSAELSLGKGAQLCARFLRKKHEAVGDYQLTIMSYGRVLGCVRQVPLLAGACMHEIKSTNVVWRYAPAPARRAPRLHTEHTYMHGGGGVSGRWRSLRGEDVIRVYQSVTHQS